MTGVTDPGIADSLPLPLPIVVGTASPTSAAPSQFPTTGAPTLLGQTAAPSAQPTTAAPSSSSAAPSSFSAAPSLSSAAPTGVPTGGEGAQGPSSNVYVVAGSCGGAVLCRGAAAPPLALQPVAPRCGRRAAAGAAVHPALHDVCDPVERSVSRLAVVRLQGHGPHDACALSSRGRLAGQMTAAAAAAAAAVADALRTKPPQLRTRLVQLSGPMPRGGRVASVMSRAARSRLLARHHLPPREACGQLPSLQVRCHLKLV